ncbi:hypothetical protein Mgra_00003882, partial [Meloidogyne graminicola]
MNKLIIALLVLAALISLSSCIPKKCKLPKNEGRPPPPVIKWWYVPSARACKTFLYKGSGGNSNRFNTKAACERTCKVI